MDVSPFSRLRLEASAMTFPFHRITDHLLFSQFTNLRCLQIRYTLIPGSFTTLRRMISALQALEELEINDVWTQRSWPLSQWELESSRRWGSKLRCFRCIFWDKPNPRSEAARATCCLEDLMGWLSTTSAVNLKKLDLQVASFQAPPGPILDLIHGPECMSFLQTVGTSVSSLTLEIAGDLILVTGRDKKLLPITWGQVCSMLSGLRSRLRYLRLGDIKYHGPSIGDVSHTDPCFCLTSGPDIGELDAVLALDIFKNLTEVEFRLGRTLICPTGIHDPRWGAQYMQEASSLSMSIGIIVVALLLARLHDLFPSLILLRQDGLTGRRQTHVIYLRTPVHVRPATITVPSPYHHRTTTVPSLYHHCTITELVFQKFGIRVSKPRASEISR
ncbi:hypothetical protein L227DRAFT_316524 [Lentinus tigrinus ALCF2SS1-6]|uniref:Uncharacterized protein n=1 Tax=Lentinus tigrinus ALCF2SS1-6 TaxID=1328759 RepID=A0A5C2SLL3_9APHY|nr:hypothetical protein L227DRAFT_316524 [Lentinus tigrinus ALCF2SS1-6]